jgi:hypothetical protein
MGSKVKRITTLKGAHVAFTGRAFQSRKALQELVRQLGGTAPDGGRVTEATTILVRGDCSVWAHDKFGKKEEKAAALL